MSSTSGGRSERKAFLCYTLLENFMNASADNEQDVGC